MPCHIGDVPASDLLGEVNLSQTQAIVAVAAAALALVLVGLIAALLGRRSGRRAISQRVPHWGPASGSTHPVTSTTSRPLAYLEQVTGGAAQAVTEASSDAIRLRAPSTP